MIKNILANDIQLIVYDFDGVLTDNKVILREDGLESVVVNRADGLAIAMIKHMGIRQIIISTETNKIVEVRAHKLGIPVIKGADDKHEMLETYCRNNHIELNHIVYLGNDINDLSVMKRVGYPMCPSDASEEIKGISKVIIDVPGGCGVVRILLKYIGVSHIPPAKPEA